MKKTGRPKKDEVKANKNKVNLDSLLSSDKEEYTKEEIKALKEELLRFLSKIGVISNLEISR